MMTARTVKSGVGTARRTTSFYLRSTPLAVFHFEDDVYLVPLGLGVGRILPLGGMIVNAFIEPQMTAYHKGQGLPSLQVFAGLNFQSSR